MLPDLVGGISSKNEKREKASPATILHGKNRGEKNLSPASQNRAKSLPHNELWLQFDLSGIIRCKKKKTLLPSRPAKANRCRQNVL